FQYSLSEAPAFAEVGLQILVRFIIIGKSHARGVPLELAVEFQRDGSQKHPFYEWRRNGEVGTRRFTAFAGANPVAIVAGRAGQEFGRKLVVFHARIWH